MPRLRGGDRRQRDDDRPRARHRPRAAGGGAVRDVHGAPTDVLAHDLGLRPAPACAGIAVPRPRRLRRRRHRRRHARHRHGPRQADPAVHRRRHQLRDRAQRRRHASCPPPRRPARPSRAARSGAACAPPTARSRSSSSTPPTSVAVELGVIGDVAPKGLCGSGLVDAVAELVRVGLLDSCGRFVPDDAAAEMAPALADRLTKVGEERVFVLHRPDARHRRGRLRLPLPARRARAAVRARPRSPPAGRCSSRSSGCEHRDVQQVLLAGSFGSYLSPASAVRIGLVPKLPVLRIVSAGNVAGEGAKMALLSLRERVGAAGAAGGGEVCRALRPPRLQRQVRRPARLPELTPRGRADRLRGDRPARGRDRRAARLAGRRTPAAAAAAQPAAPDRRRGRAAGRRAAPRRTTRSWSGTPTAAPTAPSTRCASDSGCAGSRGCTATTCTPAPAGSRRSSTTSPAPTC